LNGMVTDDIDGDGNLDIVINGNDYGTEVTTGRYDALNGLVLKGDGKGGFSTQSILQSGIYIPGNGKSLAKLRSRDNHYLLAAAQNRGPLKIFKLKKNVSFIAVQLADATAMITFRNGKLQKQECYYGSSFLSQSARYLTISPQVLSVTITSINGQQRKIQF
jgi:hypothetical protein